VVIDEIHTSSKIPGIKTEYGEIAAEAQHNREYDELTRWRFLPARGVLTVSCVLTEKSNDQRMPLKPVHGLLSPSRKVQNGFYYRVLKTIRRRVK
jgi:hypothetical protein